MNALELVQTFVRAIGNPIFVIDEKSKSVLFYNEAAEELTGFEGADLQGQNFLNLVSESYRARLEAMLDLLPNLTQGQSLHENDMEIERVSRRTIPVNITASCLHSDVSHFFIISVEDLTEVKRIQSERSRLEMESLRISKLADMGRLTAGIAHELNNPLAVIMGSAENIKMLVEERAMSPQAMKSQLDTIVETCKRMAKIIRKMMNIVHNESPDFEMVLFPTAFDNVLTILDEQIQAQGIEIKKDLEPNCQMKGDSVLIEQVLQNILQNAVHALKANTAKKEIRITVKKLAAEILVELWNNGPEIPREDMDKLFTPFHTSKDPGEGTGLGLFVCYHIVLAHGGRIDVSSSKTGTSFQLKFKI